MDIPKGVQFEGVEDPNDWVLKLKRNLYGQRQAGRVWNQHLHKGLMELGYRQSQIDECVYFRDGLIFLVYTDDGIFAHWSKEIIDNAVEELQTKFKVTDEGDLSDYLGVNITYLEGGRIKLSQPHLINQILKYLNFQDHTKPKMTPAASTKILNRDENGEAHNAS